MAAEAYNPVVCDIDTTVNTTSSNNSRSETPKSSKAPLKRKKSPKLSNPVVAKCVEMGFSQGHVEYAVKELKVENPRPEMVVAWLLDHPEVNYGTKII